MSDTTNTARTASIAWLGCAGITLVLLVVSIPQALFVGDFIPALLWGLLTVALAIVGLTLRRQP